MSATAPNLKKRSCAAVPIAVLPVTYNIPEIILVSSGRVNRVHDCQPLFFAFHHAKTGVSMWLSGWRPMVTLAATVRLIYWHTAQPMS